MALIFISYRARDERHAARLVADRLRTYFGRSSVFFDDTSIPLGAEFPLAILEELREARALVAVIGPQWLTAPNMNNRNIADPEDWVHREIGEAIRGGKLIVPVLVDGARLPRKEELPPDLHPLAEREFLPIGNRTLDGDIHLLAQDLSSGIPELSSRYRQPPADAPTARTVHRRRKGYERPSTPLPEDDSGRLDFTARQLAKAVRQRWDEEMNMRGLRRPHPLRVRWTVTDLPVGACPWSQPSDEVGETSHETGDVGASGRTLTIPRHGTVGDLVEVIQTLPRRQLVVLGEAGAGKTVAATMLTLGLLESSQRARSVPVPVQIASWRPDVQHLHDWLAARLEQDFPFILAPEYGRDAALKLITTGRIMPVLDGLDEMPAALRPTAIEALDRITGGRPLVVTCRTSEYQEAVEGSGQLLTSAAVVELEPVDFEDAAFFLTARSLRAAGWKPVLTELRAHPDVPLAQALASPLIVSLARTVYTAPNNSPSELLDAGRFPDRRAVEHHLLDGLIPAVYPTYPTLNERKQSRTVKCTPEQARRWLTFLACHLDRLGTSELAWWQLTYALSTRQAGMLMGVLSAITVGLTLVVALAVASTPLNGLVFELTFGVCVGIAAGVSVRHSLDSMSERPMRLPARIRPRVPGRVAGIALLVGLAGALVFGARIYDRGIGAAVGAGLVVLSLAILLSVLLFGLAEPVEPDREVSPTTVLRSDRRGRLVIGLATSFVIGIPFWLWISPALGLGGGLAGGIAYVSSGMYGRFGQARLWLAWQRRLPLRLMTFLADAHDREVLRQEGAVYQFRHRHLQERLAMLADANQD